jgi:hypothetical protein
VGFRKRLIEKDLDRRLIERTVELAARTGGFGAEIDYDFIYPSQLEEQILGFIALAVGRE